MIPILDPALSLGSLNGAGFRAGVGSNAGVGTKFTLFLLQ